ncbi:MAG TPA: site-specific integrase, partial [Baekduia sp.]|nr:site-specific integrase [Baekduia sp.]
TGLRISEAIGLTWDAVELGDEPRIHVRQQVYRGNVRPPKSRYGIRTIPLAPRIAQPLRARRSDIDPGPGQPVFASADGGFLDSHNLRHRVLGPAVREAGLDGIGFHTLRHTCASVLFESGKNAKQVQMWLGHHDPGFTLSTYVHLLDQGLGDLGFIDDVLAA